MTEAEGERNSKGLTWEEEKALHAEMLATSEREAAKERARANEAVRAALASYRWWSPGNLWNMFRLWLGAWRYKRAQRLR